MITRKAATIFLVLIGLVVMPIVSTHAQKSPPSAPPAPGAVVWFDLLTEDANAVLEFYGELFGWDIQVHTPSHYVVVHNGQPIAGISQIQDEKSRRRTKRSGSPASLLTTWIRRSNARRAAVRPFTSNPRTRRATLGTPSFPIPRGSR